MHQQSLFDGGIPETVSVPRFTKNKGTKRDRSKGQKKSKRGKSIHTPPKHEILNQVVGKKSGVIQGESIKAFRERRDPYVTGPFLCYDLCAGDGEVTEEYDSSPAIFYKHASHWIGRKWGMKVTLIEKDQNTFGKLIENASVNGWEEGIGEGWFNPMLEDSRKFRLPTLNPWQAVFVHCDPNTVSDMPLTEDFVGGFNERTTYLATLGCNATGIKRWTPRENRESWFNYVSMLTSKMPSHHDAFLFWLKSDGHQWAYLLNLPIKWTRGPNNTIEKIIQSVDKVWEPGLGYRSYRGSRENFERELKRLFLTKKEIKKEIGSEAAQ